MGMNYYLLLNRCGHCGRCDRIHIGKASWGWTFLFQGHSQVHEGEGPFPILEVRSYKDWKRVIGKALAAGGAVVDEEDREVSRTRLYGVIRKARDGRYCDPNRIIDWLDAEGYCFKDREFL